MQAPPRILGRYALHDEIAAGGMATVHLGRLRAAGGFGRTVAIKRLHPMYARDPEFRVRFLEEARIASRVSHANVVPTIDVLAMSGELFLVMDYVHGESLNRLSAIVNGRGEKIDLRIVSAIVLGLLEGLHAIHAALDERGAPLHCVHRDVSPQNVLVGADGVTRVLDLGIAKAAGRVFSTKSGDVMGKVAYMSPEQVSGERVDVRADLWATTVVLWELLTGRRLFDADTPSESLAKLLTEDRPPPSTIRPELSADVDALLLRGLAKDPSARFASAREMAAALQAVLPPATTREASLWVAGVAGEKLSERARRVREIESMQLEDAEVPSAPDVTAPDAGRGAAWTEPPPPLARNRAAIAATAIAIMLVTIGGAAAWQARGSGAKAERSAPVAPPAPAPTPSTASPDPTPSVATVPVATSVAPPRARPATRTVPHAKAGCADPFTLGKDGIKIPKPECL
jgi:serine/threonine-protein kinase